MTPVPVVHMAGLYVYYRDLYVLVCMSTTTTTKNLNWRFEKPEKNPKSSLQTVNKLLNETEKKEMPSYSTLNSHISCRRSMVSTLLLYDIEQV